MPVTFGAVGDIISVCHLVKGLVDALDKARGSKAEYLSAVQELSILEKVLFEIACIIEEHGDGATPELQSLCETAKQAFTRCEALVDAFLQRTRRYQGTLTETAKPEVLHEATMKLRWRLAEKEALKKFRVEVAGISESLQMLLGAANIILRTETKVKLEEADQRYQAANSIQRAQLKDVLDRIENVNESIKTGNVMLYKIADALKMDWLRQLGSELKLLLYRSVAVNFATYQAVRRQQTPLPSHVEHGLIDEPFILEDAIGRKAPVHLQFITSWEAFDSILEIRFCGRQGHQKVIHKQYELQDGRTGRNLERSQSWERAFLPVQRVQMSILFHKQRPIDSGCAGIICPGCQTPAENALETDIHCKQCFIWYSRIAVVEYADHWEHAILGRLHKISSGDVSTENDIDFISDFTRVRIMSIQSGKTRRLRHYHYCNVCPSDTKMAYMCFNTFSYHFYQKHMWSLHSHAQSGFVCCSKVFEEESLLKHVWGRHVYRTYPPAQHLD